jgi:putative spermidine/putrescine transport system ATP-binding protein
MRVPATTTPDRGRERLELRDLRRSFGSFNALDGIDLTIEPGEFIALLGPSGCGKSTALNCIAGLLALTGGEIRLGGARIDQLEPEKRGFGMVFQSYALFPHMSVRKNVGFGLAMQGIRGAEANRRIEDALGLVRLESQADKLPGQLSGGQQQRVAIARAVVIRPPVVLMDEPLSNLDAKLRLEMRADIRGIHDQIGSTTIYVTHDQDEALSMADRIVVMSEGRIEQIGTPQELYQRPDNLTVADFMGFRTRIPGRVVSVAGTEAELDIEGGRVRAMVRGAIRSGDAATLSVRPEELVATPGEGIPATVESMEYRGRAWFGLASAPDGTRLYFRSGEALPRGAATTLTPTPGSALVFPGAGA